MDCHSRDTAREWHPRCVTPPRIHKSRKQSVTGLRLHVLPLTHKIGALLTSYLLIFRETEEERETETSTCCCTHLRSNWLLLVCVPTRDWTRNLGVWERWSSQLSYLARAKVGALVWSPTTPTKAVPLETLYILIERGEIGCWAGKNKQ